MKNLYLALLFSPALAFAQSSDLYLFDLHTLSDVRQISNPRLLSGFNPDGYTNQPVFLDLFKLVVSAGPDTAPAQTDLYELNLRANQLTRLTRTIDREYSPGIDPEKGYISCVLVDVKKDDEQKLWKYPVDRSTGGKAVLKGIKDVGYYTWIDDEWIAVFQVGDPSQLHLYNVRTDEKRFVSSKVGRCLKKLPGGALAYIHKIS
ncbi:MAG: hypothetical protein OEQ53_22315, partial [Saprospiraceae bacterium]|nr:hypothetical protein [Saprospiraceae bacterium]